MRARELQGGRFMDAGERAGFDAEALACQPDLLRYAARLTGNLPDAQDLVQETMLRAIVAWRSFQPGSQMGKWLRTILYRRFVSEYRRRCRMLSLSALDRPDEAGAALTEPGPDPATDMEDTWMRDEIERALGTLSPAQHVVLRLGDLEGYSGLESAALLEVSPGTVKSRVYRARQQLRRPLRAVAADCGFPLAASA